MRATDVTFTRTWLRSGYNSDEVDAFMKEAEAALREKLEGAAARLTPADVRSVRFTETRLRPGYDRQEVDAFLGELEGDLSVS